MLFLNSLNNFLYYADSFIFIQNYAKCWIFNKIDFIMFAALISSLVHKSMGFGYKIISSWYGKFYKFSVS